MLTGEKKMIKLCVSIQYFVLPKDNGERFFSEFLTLCRPSTLTYTESDLCICVDCSDIPISTNTLIPLPPPLCPVVQPSPGDTGDIRLRQQQQQQWQARAAPPAPVIAPQQQIAPLIFPCYYPQYFAHSSCCNKHQVWLYRRVGRPPHDAHCRQHRLIQQQQQQLMIMADGTPRMPAGTI